MDSFIETLEVILVRFVHLTANKTHGDFSSYRASPLGFQPHRPSVSFGAGISCCVRTSEGSKATLTTQDVAEILGCSRPHVVKLLEQGTIPFSKVGSHRRVCMEDVAEYKRSTRERQRQALIQLMQTDEEQGLYGE